MSLALALRLRVLSLSPCVCGCRALQLMMVPYGAVGRRDEKLFAALLLLLFC